LPLAVLPGDGGPIRGERPKKEFLALAQGGCVLKNTALLLLCGVLLLGEWSCCKPPAKEPGGTGADAYLAVNDPDEYAWQLFFFLNRQAQIGSAGIPDPWKKFGELDTDTPVVWETWALASGYKFSEVFLPDGSQPGLWGSLDRKSKKPLHLDQNFELLMIRAQQRASEMATKVKGRKAKRGNHQHVGEFPREFIIPPNPDDDSQEVRMNQATFESIVGQRLYNCEGLGEVLRKAQQAKDPFLVQVPLQSKEIKAQWIKIGPEKKSRYFWREDSNKQAWGLIALHIITKDMPNWFWADFGHVDCEKPKENCQTDYDNETELRDSTTDGPKAKHGSNGLRTETRGTVWANYRLRGTETGFTLPNGEPQKLSNPVIENNKQQSSCITCHAQAAMKQGQEVGTELCKSPPLGPNFVQDDQYLGAPHPEWFVGDSGTDKYLQTDFMWSPIIAIWRITSGTASAPAPHSSKK
jgi:hypothetical protein